MQSKLILSIALTSIGTITIAGSAHSKNDPLIIMPTSEALRNRGLKLSMNVEELIRLGIFDAFAQKEVLKSAIPTLVDNALDTCWNEHVNTVLHQSSDPVFFSVNIAKQSNEYKAKRAGLRATVIRILYEEIKSQHSEQTKNAVRENQE